MEAQVLDPKTHQVCQVFDDEATKLHVLQFAASLHNAGYVRSRC